MQAEHSHKYILALPVGHGENGKKKKIELREHCSNVQVFRPFFIILEEPFAPGNCLWIIAEEVGRTIVKTGIFLE